MTQFDWQAKEKAHIEVIGDGACSRTQYRNKLVCLPEGTGEL